MFTQVIKEKKDSISTCLILHHIEETCGGVEVQLSTFFSSAIDGTVCGVGRGVHLKYRLRETGN
jgi:hypothetical protein